MPSLRALLLTALVLAVLGAPAGAVLAQSLTWLLDPAVDAETRERIEGQTSDLLFVLRPVSSTQDSPHPAEQGQPLARARRLASGSGARVVVWTTPREGGLEVTIVDLEGRRVLVREVPANGTEQHSAALETVGLIVRSALQALAEGGEIGVSTPPAVQELTQDAETGREVPSDGPEEPTPESPEEQPVRSEVMLGAGFGMRFLVDRGPAFEGSGLLAWRYGRLWLGASVHASARRSVRAASAAISVASVGAALDVGALAFERGAFALVPLASLSLGRIRRETVRVANGFVGTGSRTHLDLRAGAGLRLRVALGDVAWLTLEARMELPFGRVLYTVRTDADAVTLARTPRIAPAFGLALLARIGRTR